jgi:hypothetical protein
MRQLPFTPSRAAPETDKTAPLKPRWPAIIPLAHIYIFTVAPAGGREQYPDQAVRL